MHDGRAGLVVLLFRNPHLLEARQGRQNRPSNPNRVLALYSQAICQEEALTPQAINADGLCTYLRRGDDLDLNARRRQCRDLLGETVGDAWVHRGAARHDDVLVEITPDVHCITPS